MKLHEVKLRPEATTISREEYLDKTCRLMPELSSGSFASVYSEPRSSTVTKVTKLATPPSGDPYFQYIRYCMKLKNNPFLPRFYSVRVFHCPHEKKQGDEFYGVITMEKLIGHGDLPKNTEIEAGDFYDQYMQLRNEIVWRQDRDGNDVGYIETTPTFDSLFKVLIHSTRNVHLATAFKVLRNLLKRRKGFVDIHKANLMWRHEEGNVYQLVITDPFAQF